MDELHYARWASDLANGYYGPLVDFKIDFNKIEEENEEGGGDDKNIDTWWSENVSFKKYPKHLFQPPKIKSPPEKESLEDLEKYRREMYRPTTNDSIIQYITLDSGIVVMKDPKTGEIIEPIVFDDDELESITFPLLKALDDPTQHNLPIKETITLTEPPKETKIEIPHPPPPPPPLPPKKRFVKKEIHEKVVGNLIHRIKSHALYPFSKFKILLNYMASYNVKTISSIKINKNGNESSFYSTYKFTNDKNEIVEFTYLSEDVPLFKILRLLTIPRLSIEELKILKLEDTFKQIEHSIKKDYENNTLLVFHLKTISEVMDSKKKDKNLICKFNTFWKRDVEDIKKIRQSYPTMVLWDIHDFMKTYNPMTHSMDINGFNILTLSKLKEDDKNQRVFNFYSGIYQPFVNYFLLLYRPKLFFNSEKNKSNRIFDSIFKLDSPRDAYSTLYTPKTWNLNHQFEWGFKYLFDEFVCSRLVIPSGPREMDEKNVPKELSSINNKLETTYKSENNRVFTNADISSQNIGLGMFPPHIIRDLLCVYRNLNQLGLEIPPTINSQVNNYLKVSREILRSRSNYIKKRLSNMRNIKKSIVNQDYYHPYLLPIHYFSEITNRFKEAQSYQITIFGHELHFYIYLDTNMKKLVKHYKMPADLKEVLQSMLILYNHKIYYGIYNCLKNVSDEISNPIAIILYFLNNSCPFPINMETSTLN